jgi:RNA polymerase sigma factor for flagellar operon FliA
MNTAIANSVVASRLPTTRTTRKAPAKHLACKKQKQHDAEVAEYMPLVHKIANQVHRHVNGQADREDLVSWGTTGLLEAMKRFEPGRETRLSTFAYYRIRGAMLDGIGKVAPLSRKCYRNARAAGDMHAIYREDCEAEEIIDPRSAISPEDFAERQQLQSLLESAISNLSEDQQHLVRKHYFAGETLLDAGKTIGISKSWACRSHAKALNNLRVEMQRAVAA